MREITYQDFSIRTHQKNWQAKKPNLCQFELTFKCALRCRYCYADCYNKEEFFPGELNTERVKGILDRLEEAGIIWLCFTGGDPLTRGDFLELYFYAKKKGFIVTIFTNGYSMTAEIAGYLAKTPPFVIEMTLNAVSEDLYERMTRVKGSFKKTMRGIGRILEAKLPLKIKTQITRENVQHVPEIKKYVQGLGLSFCSSVDLHARLNGDLAPCDLRVAPKEIPRLKTGGTPECAHPPDGHNQTDGQTEYLFNCAVSGGDGFYIDPYGNMSLCGLLRENNAGLWEKDIRLEQERLLSLVRNKKFTTNSPCSSCRLRKD
ncbi:MAG: radical SAM protein, partial [Candidatus Omnitrophota bacterium]